MKDEQFNRAIAEACGYEKSGKWWRKPNGEKGVASAYLSEPPNYYGDLNQMHEAETHVPRADWSSYTMELRRIIQRDCNTEEHYLLEAIRSQMIADFWFYHATARQRAEAFLRTLNLWKGPNQ